MSAANDRIDCCEVKSSFFTIKFLLLVKLIISPGN
jgi:hypothetical protein